MKKLFYYSMIYHTDLKEALKSRVLITENEFKILFEKYNFKYYCFDDRLNCTRFIKGNLKENLNIPQWLLIEYV